MQKNRKGVELPINILVMIALAVFVIFLSLGFLTGGWGYFGGLFGKTTKTQTGLDAVRQDCKNRCSQFANEGSPVIDVTTTDYEKGYWYGKLLAEVKNQDLNGDGVFDESYSCRGDLRPATYPQGAKETFVLTASDCPVQTNAP